MVKTKVKHVNHAEDLKVNVFSSNNPNKNVDKYFIILPCLFQSIPFTRLGDLSSSVVPGTLQI